ncbi:MAG TPA: TetR family transcriptional regulator C-terminal domain-containing protein [Anaerolineaceae bacterium]|nr:TetR family transcriptional regulator C-terminal domain-containing protein [Anaerolineaceae bacterium]
MFLEFWTQASHDPAIWKETVAPYRHYQELFAGILQRGIEKGQLREIDPQMGARAIVGLAVGLLLQGLLDPQGAEWGRTTQDAITLFMEGMLRRET